MPKGEGLYDIRGCYTIYPSIDAERQRLLRDTKIEFTASVTDVSASLHSMLYAQLKTFYPDSTNIL